jgi:hypothetical protein
MATSLRQVGSSDAAAGRWGEQARPASIWYGLSWVPGVS